MRQIAGPAVAASGAAIATHCACQASSRTSAEMLPRSIKASTAAAQRSPSSVGCRRAVALPPAARSRSRPRQPAAARARSTDCGRRRGRRSLPGASQPGRRLVVRGSVRAGARLEAIRAPRPAPARRGAQPAPAGHAAAPEPARGGAPAGRTAGAPPPTGTAVLATCGACSAIAGRALARACRMRGWRLPARGLGPASAAPPRTGRCGTTAAGTRACAAAPSPGRRIRPERAPSSARPCRHML